MIDWFAYQINKIETEKNDIDDDHQIWIMINHFDEKENCCKFKFNFKRFIDYDQLIGSFLLLLKIRSFTYMMGRWWAWLTDDDERYVAYVSVSEY